MTTNAVIANLCHSLTKGISSSTICHSALVFLLLTLITSTATAADDRYLVRTDSQVSGLTDISASTIDPESGGQSEATLPKGQSFTVDLEGDGVTLTDTEGLVVTFGRWSDAGSPKATKVEGSADGANWDVLGYAYMQFRGGNGTVEYSKPIYANDDSKGKTYKQLRFTVLKTALGYAPGDKICINKFNVFLLKNGDEYPDGRIDPWRLNTDYYKDYKDYSFKPTNGILSPRNHYGNNVNYPTETPWGENNTFFYEGRRYELPTFKMQDDNQMPHVTEHTVYVMPGEIIPLLPYYDMPRNYRYYNKFSHWYKYNKDVNGVPQAQDYGHVIDEKTGERLLDFLVDPAGVTYTNGAGFFGGIAIPRKGARFVIRSIADLLSFQDSINDGKTNLDAILAGDIDFSGEEAETLGVRSVILGSSSNPYRGTFNGNGHTIKNMKIDGSGGDPVGLFSYVAPGAAIKNLIIKDCDIKNNGNAGILIGQTPDEAGSVSINSVLMSGNIEVSGNGQAGSVVGFLGNNTNVDISNVAYRGKIISERESAALVGYIQTYSDSYVSVANSYVDAFVSKFKNDTYNGYYGAAVNGSITKHSFANCVFNLTTSVSSNSEAIVYTSQTGADTCEYDYVYNSEPRTDYSDPQRIYIAKDDWTDFVLCVSQWGPVSIIAGCTGWKEIGGKTYGYFDNSFGQYIQYSIIPYKGEKNLKEEIFSWDMEGLSPVCSIVENDWNHNDDEYLKITQKELKATLSSNPVFSEWPKDEEGTYAPPMTVINDKNLKYSAGEPSRYLSNPDLTGDSKRPQSWYGTSATFFKPLDTSKAPDDTENLELGTHSFDIAVDFSHEFDATSSHNLDDDAQTFYSPVINYRHIFHVVSGKDFADSVTSSAAANKKYLAGKRRVVYAPYRVKQGNSDKPEPVVFVVRLPTEFPVPYKKRPNQWLPIPDNIYSSTNFYYKSDDTHYDRASGFDIEIYKDGKSISDSRFAYEGDEKPMFDFEETPRNADDYNYSQGIRKYYEDGPTYYTAGGEGVVYRMLECQKPEVGTYTVRIYALDDSGNPLHIWNDPDSKIYMMEYEITFLGEDDASVKQESDIPDKHKDSYLSDEEVCGDPVVTLNFDEYKAFEDASVYNQDDYFQSKDGNTEFKSFKWPTIWSQCSYSFGYGEYLNYDYNEYLIANHGSQARWPDSPPSVYDRLYHDTKDTDTPEMGYFYWVNAASDPGVTSRLRIDRLCMGSTVVVTAWISDFSGTTFADVAFNFSAVMKDGSRQRLHTFVSEPVDTSADWYHVYYSFVPVLPETINSSDVDHYEIEVENNCQSSKGADYAVDDIRAYIVSPEITAEQLSPLCDRETPTGIKISTRFDKLLQAQDITEAKTEEDAEDCYLYIAMFDRVKYDNAYSDYEVSQEDAINNSLVKILDDEGKPQDFLKIKMSTFFGNLPEYKESELTFNKALGELSPKGVELLRAFIMPCDDNMYVGKQYYVSVRLVDGHEDAQKELVLADLAVSQGDCARYGVMTLQGSGIVKVDGFAFSTKNDDEIEVCIGQSPVLQVALMKKDAEGNMSVSDGQYYYDWYRGPLDDFGMTVFEPLSRFRNAYPDATEIPAVEDRDSVSSGVTGKDFRILDALVRSGDLVLRQSSYVFPPITAADLYDGGKLYVTAMPIVTDWESETEILCSQPNEICLSVRNSAPGMFDGFDKMDYPEGMADVPLRVGLRQLREVSSKVTDLPDDFLRRLEVPLRAIKSYKGAASAASMKPKKDEDENGAETDPYVYIVGTNDPRYRDLTKHPGDAGHLVDGFEVTKVNPVLGVIEGLLPVGIVTNMEAVKGGAGNAVKIVFSKDMQFREGYYYTMRFDFDEILDESAAAAGYCSGQTVFTIKVVPEYQRWTGEAGRNWNNDDNWTRVAKTELFLGEDDTEIGSEKVAVADHTTDEDGDNTNLLSYSPLDFTKVIVPKEVDNFPLMFRRTLTDVPTLHDNRKWDSVDTDTDAANHDATADIRYDMASLSLDDVLACRPWYANTCGEIHFQYGAELQRQQWFDYGDNYQKAWVDLETQPERWYTLATPLKQVVAGDMYTVSAGSKQNTELFREMKFDNSIYGRFDPAVYQRSWNRAGDAELYEFEDKTNAHTDAAQGISLNWSRTYNQVDVDYSSGHGFSINTRPMTLATGEDADNMVRFRLPKADDNYSYFTPDDESDKSDDKDILIGGEKRDERHSLNDATMTAVLTAKDASKYFLTGNPFIARMDMAAFFDGNSGTLNRKYWIMSDDRQSAYLWNPKSGKFISTQVEDGDEDDVVAPMQGFFVEAVSDRQELSIEFTPDMIKVTDGGGQTAPLKVAAAPGGERMLTVTATVDGEDKGRAVILISGDASAEYDPAEDAAMMIDRSLEIPAAVYTGASGRALAINSLDRIERTEVGLAASPETHTLLRFNGVDGADGLMLLDTATGEEFALHEDFTFEVVGSTAGRLYLVGANDGMDPVEDLSVMLQGRSVSVSSPEAGIEVRGYDSAGVFIGEWTADGRTLSFDVAPGIIIIDVTAGGERLTRKFIVK